MCARFTLIIHEQSHTYYWASHRLVGELSLQSALAQMVIRFIRVQFVVLRLRETLTMNNYKYKVSIGLAAAGPAGLALAPLQL